MAQIEVHVKIMKFYDVPRRNRIFIPAFLAAVTLLVVKKLRAVSLWRWVSGLGFGLLVLATGLPGALTAIHDSHGRSTGQFRFDPFASGWVISYTVVAVGCVLFGRRTATIVGIIMLAAALFS